MKVSFLLYTLLIASLGWQNAHSSPEGEKLAKKVEQATRYQGQDAKAFIDMEIEDSQGRKRTREFYLLRKNGQGKKQKFFVYFKKPADVQKMTFMVWKNIDKSDDRWLYLPSLDLERRIAPSDKRTSFVGSDYFYEDISGRILSEDSHEIIKNDKGLLQLKGIPKDPNSAEFTHCVATIDPKTHLPQKVEFYKKDKLYRKNEILEVKTIQGIPTITSSRMSDLETGSKTTVKIKEISYNQNLPDKVFTQRALKKPPRKYLK